MNRPLPDNNIPIEVGDRSFVYKNIYHPIVWIGDEPYRPRVETLVLKNNGQKLWIKFHKEKKADRILDYEFPGGSLDADSTMDEQAENEVNEEALIKIKNLYNTGVQYYETFSDFNISQFTDFPISYKGFITNVYIAEYDGKYDKKNVEKKDLDPEMFDNGKFSYLTTVADKLSNDHLQALSTSPLVNNDVKRSLHTIALSKGISLESAITESTNNKLIFDDNIIPLKSTSKYNIIAANTHIVNLSKSTMPLLTLALLLKDIGTFVYTGSLMESQQFAVDFWGYNKDSKINNNLILNAPIHSINDGTVEFVSDKVSTSDKKFKQVVSLFGKCVVIKHSPIMYSLYGHMNNISVKPGQKVSKGQIIGKVGNTGNSSQPHLHFQVCLLNPKLAVKTGLLHQLTPLPNVMLNSMPVKFNGKYYTNTINSGMFKDEDSINSDYSNNDWVLSNDLDLYSFKNITLISTDGKRPVTEATLSSKERNNLNDSEFGVPEERKYPLTDESHVRSAIKFFNKVNPKYEKELATNINKKIKEYDMGSINIGKDNKFLKYYKESLTSSFKGNNIPLLETPQHIVVYRDKMAKLENETGEPRISRLATYKDGGTYQKFNKDDRKFKPHVDITKIIDEDTYLIADLHFGKFGENRDNNLINRINRIPTNSTLIILGDVGYVKTACADYIQECCNKIKVKHKYLILGNHDCYPMEFYYNNLNFDGVYEVIVLPKKNWILSHQPCNGPTDGYINFHGHLHDDTDYYPGVNELENKINCWEGFCPEKPFTVREWYIENMNHPKRKVFMEGSNMTSDDKEILLEYGVLDPDEFNVQSKFDLVLQRKYKLTEGIIDRLRDDYPAIGKAKISKDSRGYVYLDKADNIIGIINVEPTLDERYTKIQRLEVGKSFRGLGIADQLLNVAVNELGADYIEIPTTNERMTKTCMTYGFKKMEETDRTTILTYGGAVDDDIMTGAEHNVDYDYDEILEAKGAKVMNTKQIKTIATNMTKSNTPEISKLGYTILTGVAKGFSNIGSILIVIESCLFAGVLAIAMIPVLLSILAYLLALMPVILAKDYMDKHIIKIKKQSKKLDSNTTKIVKMYLTGCQNLIDCDFMDYYGIEEAVLLEADDDDDTEDDDVQDYTSEADDDDDGAQDYTNDMDTDTDDTDTDTDDTDTGDSDVADPADETTDEDTTDTDTDDTTEDDTDTDTTDDTDTGDTDTTDDDDGSMDYTDTADDDTTDTGTNDTDTDSDSTDDDSDSTDNAEEDDSNKNSIVKNYNLILDFQKMYRMIGDVLSKLEYTVFANSLQNSAVERLIENLQKLNENILTYIDFSFKDDYPTNLYNYNIYLRTLKLNLELLSKTAQLIDEDSTSN